MKLFGKENENLPDLQFYLGSIIEQRYMTEGDIKGWGRTEADSLIYYNWLYRYSHTKLVTLFKVSPIGKIYEYFYTTGMEEVAETESSLKKNPILYRKVLGEFLAIFRGEVDIHTFVQ